MSPDEYRAAIKALGLTPCKPSYQGHTLHQTRDNELQQVRDPEGLTPEERVAAIEFLKWLLDITTH